MHRIELYDLFGSKLSASVKFAYAHAEFARLYSRQMLQSVTIRVRLYIGLREEKKTMKLKQDYNFILDVRCALHGSVSATDACRAAWG